MRFVHLLRFLKGNAKGLSKIVFSICLGLAPPLLLGFLLLPGWAAGPGPNLTPALVSPMIHPLRNTHTAPATTSVSISYEPTIDPNTLSRRTFAVHAMQTGLLGQTFDTRGGMIVLTPTHLFKPGELVQATATTGTLFLEGQGPASPTVWQFRTLVTGGTGYFVDAGQDLSMDTTNAIALGDLDGDGDLDAYLANYDRPNQVWLNDGHGNWSGPVDLMSSKASRDVALGDLDGDGDLDAFVANYNQANQVWLNDGNADFSWSHEVLSDTTSWAVALGDLDGDGDLDAIVANGVNSNEVCLNDGTGKFAGACSPLLRDSTCPHGSTSRGVALGDVDGDGDLDAFFAIYEGQNEVWLNNGQGQLQCCVECVVTSSQDGFLGDERRSTRAQSTLLSLDVALGDLDGDGDLDAFVANQQARNTVWINLGGKQNGKAGRFQERVQELLDTTSSKSVSLGDLDADGDLDVFVANDGINEVLLNNGNGEFTSSEQSLDDLDSEDAVLGDLNGDGALDAVVANGKPDQVTKTWLGIQPKIEFSKTVGTEPDICSSRASILVPPGKQATVYYCYAATNTGNVALTVHRVEDDRLPVDVSDVTRLDPGETRYVLASTKLDWRAGDVVNVATWSATATADDAPGVRFQVTAAASATVGFIAPDAKISYIMPLTSCFLQNVEFVGTGLTDTITPFLDEYRWERTKVVSPCVAGEGELLGTEAQIQDNRIPPGKHKICLWGMSNGLISDRPDSAILTVLPDRWAFSDIAVGPQSVTFWYDRAAEKEPALHPDVGDTVFAKIEVSNISVQNTPDEVTVSLYDGAIIGARQETVRGKLVATDTIAAIAAQSSESVIIPWTLDGPIGYRVFGVSVEYTENISYFGNHPNPPWTEPYLENDYGNNRASAALPVGSVAGIYALSVTAQVVPPPLKGLRAGGPACVYGKANYAWDVLLATMGATTTIQIWNLEGYSVVYPPETDSPLRTTSPGGSYRYCDGFQLPPESGIYTATVVVDDGNLIGWKDISFTVKEPDFRPDLYLERFSVRLSDPPTYPDTWYAYPDDKIYMRKRLFGVQNEPITISAWVRNNGTDPAREFQVSFYDGAPATGKLLGRSAIVPELAGGDRAHVFFVWIPSEARRYYVQAMVDAADQVDEFNEYNNYDSYYYRYQLCLNGLTDNCLKYSPRDIVDVRAAAPDLKVEGPGARENLGVDEGGAIRMTAQVRNIGPIPVAKGDAFTVKAYDGYIGASGTQVISTQQLRGPLQQGQSRFFEVVWDTGATGADAGPHQICVQVAAIGVGETFKENNVYCWPVYVYPLEPDLYPFKLTYSERCPVPNTEIDITAHFVNRGAVPFTGIATAVVTSEHPSVSLPISLAGPLPGRGGTGTTTFKWRTPDSHGTTYLYVEYNKPEGTYNVGPHRYAQRLNICKNPAPDLAVYSEDIGLYPDPPAANDQVQVTAKISNIGSSPVATATHFEVRFHTSGPGSGYHQLGPSTIIPTLGPGESISVPIPPKTLTFAMADPYYAVQVSVWPRVQQGDANYGNNEATTTFLQKDAVVLELETTVGTKRLVCADTETISVAKGTEVFYCYRITNRSGIDLSAHNLRDSMLGDILIGRVYSLKDGASFHWIESTVPTDTTTSTAVWTASTEDYTLTAEDRVTVYVIPPTYLPLVWNAYSQPDSSSVR